VVSFKGLSRFNPRGRALVILQEDIGRASDAVWTRWMREKSVHLPGTEARFPDCRARSLVQRFPNWGVASRFVVGGEKFLKCDFLT
jgi:hypothetical protein